MNLTLRDATSADLPRLAQIDQSCEHSARWNPLDYLQYHTTVACVGGRVAGFLVTRRIAPDESEILNLAVEPSFRRHGAATRLLRQALSAHPGAFHLEVRESNAAARQLYRKLGFSEVTTRQNYYQSPNESAIVMRWQS